MTLAPTPLDTESSKAFRAFATYVKMGASRVISKLFSLGGKCLVTADHGNCELMRNPDGSPNTAHTTNLVHFVYVVADAAQFRVEDGILADVAPTLLFLLGLPQPVEMTGRNLLVRCRKDKK